MATIKINDLEVAFSEAGNVEASTPPVVFVHGLAEGKESWSQTQHDFSAHHTFAYDLRGHGGTTLGRPHGTLVQLGNDLISFLQEVTGPAIVVGFSLGGTIALWAAAERPDLVERTIVLGTSTVVGRGAVEFYNQRIAMASDTTTEEFRNAIRQDTAAALHKGDDQLEAITDARLEAIGDGSGYINASKAMAALRENPLTPRLSRVSSHVDVIGAEYDSFCPFKAAQIIVEGLNDVTYREVPEAGHLMNVDNAHDVTEILSSAI